MFSFRPTLLAFFILGTGGCRADAPRFTVHGQLANNPVSTTVDSALARNYLKFLMGTELENSAFAQLQTTLKRFEERPLSNETLTDLARVASTDFAALYFAQRSTAANQILTDRFFTYASAPVALPAELTSDVVVVFVPGLFYRSHPETKGDLVDAERVVRSLGVVTTRVETLDAGTVEQNAALIVDFVSKYDAHGAKLVLVSASKGGPEVLLAVSALAEQYQRRIAAWVSIGGVLKGSALADEWLDAPKSWLASLALRMMRASPELVQSLSTTQSAKRFADATFKLPPHFVTVHYVAVPLSGTVTADVRPGYERLNELGPNDGITLLCDELLPSGRVIVELGLDHRFSDPRIAEKTAALTRLTLELLHDSE